MAESILTIWKQNLTGDVGSVIFVWFLLMLAVYLILKYGGKK